MKKKLNKTYLLFYLLVLYILFQFIWWEILLVKQTQTIHIEKERLSALSISNTEELKKEINVLKATEKNQIYMIVGEGTVFLILISLGILRVYNTFNKETFLTRQQSNFLMSISHELKTPLTAIKLNSETILLRKPSEQITQKLLGNIVYETERLNLLVDNILISSRLDSSATFELNKEKVDLNIWIEELIIKSFSERDREFISFAKNGKCFCKIDPLLFPSVIINLVENALKYSGNKSVEISTNCNDKEVWLNISDSGIGIPESERELIFERFYRIGNEETRKTKGTGLGLYIANEIVRLHQGTIKVLGKQEGGSVFTVKIAGNFQQASV